MSIFTYVVGIVPADSVWLKMKTIYDTCRELGVAIPEQVDAFFNYETPDAAGEIVPLKQEPWEAEDCSGYEVKLDDIPEKVKIIRFYNSM